MVKYKATKRAKFISRPNRFIAKVILDGNIETVHVKNTGRCKELLTEGCDVVLYESDNPSRKTKYDLVAVYKHRKDSLPLLINMDSQIPNDVVDEWLKKGRLFERDAVIRREVVFGDSRFDFYVRDGDRKAFIEVKGVTLEEDRIAKFPDAPTERGVKHINELVSAVKLGYEAYVIFVIQMKEIDLFTPNDATHKAFGDALRAAASQGVRVIALDCIVSEDTIEADGYVPIEL